MHQPRNWFSSVQDNTLRKMKRMGFTPAEIGEKLGRTEYTVRERARTMGMPAPKPKPIRTRPVPAKRPSLFSVWED